MGGCDLEHFHATGWMCINCDDCMQVQRNDDMHMQRVTAELEESLARVNIFQTEVAEAGACHAHA